MPSDLAAPSPAANRVRREIAAGGPSFGSWCNLPTSLSAETIASAGFAWVAVDLQHGGVTFNHLAGMTQAIELGGAVPVVRVSWNDPAMVMRALDLGATGVIIPMVNDADEARRAAEAMRYPPLGVRSMGMTRRKYGGSPDAANAEVLCLPMIETAHGLANVDAIAAVPGVDGLFVGPTDLGLSLGHGLNRERQHPEVGAAMDAAVAAARRNGIFVGTVAASAAHAADLVRRGVQLVSLGAEKGFVQSGATASLAALRDG